VTLGEHEPRAADPADHILIGFTELILDKSRGPHRDAGGILNDVPAEQRASAFLIQRHLDLSKVEAGKLELQITDVHLRRFWKADGMSKGAGHEAQDRVLNGC